MKVFNNLEEMKPYYNEETNTYIFSENNRLIDIKIDFDLNIECNINARNINALDIKARDIQALYIKALDIKARNIKALDIKACNINSGNIKACDIEACNINALDIKARETFVCESIEGRRENSKYFCLDSEVVIKSQKS